MNTISCYIEDIVTKKKPGEIIFLTDFKGKGSPSAINKALSRITTTGIIKKLSRGIYYVPKTDPILGELLPSADDVTEIYARKNKIRIKPSALDALNRLGLSTQVPTRRIYITDGNARKLKLGKLHIKFIPRSSKKLSTIGQISGLVIQALEELSPENLTPQMEIRILDLLRQEKPEHLLHDLKLTSRKIKDYIVKLLAKGHRQNPEQA